MRNYPRFVMLAVFLLMSLPAVSFSFVDAPLLSGPERPAAFKYLKPSSPMGKEEAGVEPPSGPRLSVSAVPASPDLPPNRLNLLIRSAGAGWKAGRTSMTKLTAQERRARLGVAEAPTPRSERREAVRSASLTVPPPALDWRNNGGNFVTGVRDQGACGSCWAFGSTAALESRALITANTPGVDLDLSEQVVLTCSGVGSCGGGWLVTDYFTGSGVPPESCYPYAAVDSSCSDAAANWGKVAYKTEGYSWIVPYGTQATQGALKQGLVDNGPLVITYAVYDDFFSYTSGVYSHVYGALAGYHAVLLVGYDDSHSCFIVKNSWGSGWGEGGYFRIAYSELTGDTDFGYETLAYGPTRTGLGSAILDPKDGAGVGGTARTVTGLATAATGGNALQRVDVSTDGGSNWSQATGTSTWSYSWTLPGEGSYNLMSRARDTYGNLEAASPGITVYIDHSPPSSTITAPADGAVVSGSGCTVTGTAADNTGGSGLRQVEVSTDGGSTWSLASGGRYWSFGWTPAATGTYVVKARATDMSGNVETICPAVTIYAKWPSSAITAPANGATINATSCLITGTAADTFGMGISRVDVSTDGGLTWNTASGTTSWSYSWSVPPTAETYHTIKCRATDSSGGVEYVGPGVTVLVDNAGPEAHPQGVWEWKTGNTPGNNYIWGVATDKSGNVYAAGYAQGTRNNNQWYEDIVVMKYNPDGQYQWTRQIAAPKGSSEGVAEPLGIGLDASGNIYVAGQAWGSVAGQTYAGGNYADIFLLKLNSAGNTLWAREWGTTGADQAYANCLAVDPQGNAYVQGMSEKGLFNEMSYGWNCFLMKCDTNGNRVWLTYPSYPYTFSMTPYGISLDASGHIYISGEVNYSPLDGCEYLGGQSDIFVMKLDQSPYTLSNVLWRREFGSAELDKGTDVCVDQAGNAYVVGFSMGSVDGAINPTGPPYEDIVVAKFDRDGNKVWTREMGTTGDEIAVSAELDPSGNLCVMGWSFGAFDGGTVQGASDAVFLKFDKDGNKLWSREYGTSGYDNGLALAVDQYGNIYGGGNSGSYDNFQFDLTKMSPGAVNIDSGAWTASSGSVTLKLAARDRSGVSRYRISNDGVFDTEPWVDTPGYSDMTTEVSWTLSAGYGLKTVYVQFMDGLGNISPVYTDTISRPEAGGTTSSITSPAGGMALAGSTFLVTGTASDDGTGISRVEVSMNGGSTWTTVTGTASWSYLWTLPADGQYTILSRATCVSNRVETPGPGVTVTVDGARPTSAITYPSGGALLGGSSCTITGTSSDGPGSGVRKVEVSTDGGATWHDAAGTASWSYAWTLPAEEGNLTIKSRATDMAGNPQSPHASAAVTLDNRPPTPSTHLWTKQRGTSYDDTGDGVAVDKDGNVFVCGMAGYNMDNVASAGGYLSKFASDGTWLWTRRVNIMYRMGGVAVDNDGSAYIAGDTLYSFDGYTLAGGFDVLLVKFDKDGNQVWMRGAGSTESDYARAVTTDKDGHVFVAGETYGSIDGCVRYGTTDFFVIKYDKDGTKLWTQEMGDKYYEGAIAACTDDTGNVYLTGYNSIVGYVNIVTAKYSPAGSRLWVAREELGSIFHGVGHGEGITSDADGNVYVAAWTCRGDEGSANANLLTIKYSPDGEKIWSRADSSAGYHEDEALGMAMDGSGGLYVAGVTAGRLNGGVNAGGEDLFLAKYDTAGNLLWTQQRGSASDDRANGVYAGRDGNVYVAGNTKSVLPGCNGAGAQDLFVSKFAPDIMTINGGARCTGSTSATLAFYAQDLSGIAGMRLSNDGVFDGLPWDTYTASRAWTLTSGEGTKTVYAEVKDGAGNVASYSGSIILDTTAPSSSISYPADAAVVSGAFCTITGTASDGEGSGIRYVEVSTDGGGTWHAASGAASWSYAWQLPAPGSCVILSRATDNAGIAESPGAGITVTVTDTVAPSSLIAAPANGASLSGASYTVTGTAADTPGSGVKRVEVSTDGGATWGAASGTASWSFEWALPAKGAFTVRSRATDNSDNLETPGPGIVVNVDRSVNAELQHYSWSPAFGGGSCASCHTAQSSFLPPGFMGQASFCSSCHNASSVAHGRALPGGYGHPTMVNVTTGGSTVPTYGNITGGEYNNQPFSRLGPGGVVECVTCHNAMRKSEDYGRSWEYTTTADQTTYTLQWGPWSSYGYLVPRVYRDTTLWAGPSYLRDRKAYLVAPDEYAYDETAGTIRFRAQQAANAYVYASLDYPYLRVSSKGNRLCTDCHVQQTHKGINCLTCHQTHGGGNIKGIRDRLRTTNLTTVSVSFRGYTGQGSFADGDGSRDGVCEVCHTQTKYYRRDGTGFVNHSGGVNQDGKDCTLCHSHATGFAR